jgi:hypothetical protein
LVAGQACLLVLLSVLPSAPVQLTTVAALWVVVLWCRWSAPSQGPTTVVLREDTLKLQRLVSVLVATILKLVATAALSVLAWVEEAITPVLLSKPCPAAMAV